MHDDEQAIHANHWLVRGQRVSWAAVIIMAIGMTIMYCHRPPPMVFPVNSQMQPVGLVYPVTSIQAIPDPLIHGWIRNFIRNAFTVSTSYDEETILLDETAGCITGQAHDKLAEWMERDRGAHDPATHYTAEWVETYPLAEVKTAAADSYQATFETVTHKQGDDQPVHTRWHMDLHLTTAAPIAVNPTGIYVDWMNFAQEQQ